MNDNDTIRDWDPSSGDLCQGDVLVFRLPDGMAPSKEQPIPARGHQLILAEGEVTGHHHAIWMHPLMFRDDGLARGLEADFKPAVKSGADSCVTGVAAMYADDGLTRSLLGDGHISTDTLVIGYLTVENAPVVLRHQEHDAIRIPAGVYYVGRQRENHAGLERRVAD